MSEEGVSEGGRTRRNTETSQVVTIETEILKKSVKHFEKRVFFFIPLLH